MIKTRFTAQLLSGQFVTRTSTTMAYTHAVVCGNRAISWHTTHELAQRGLAQAARYYGFAPSAISVVPVTAEQMLPKRTSAADKNATRRGVISREIKSWTNYMIRSELVLEEWKAKNAEQNKSRLIRDFGEARGLELHTKQDADVRWAPTYARDKISKLEAERAALLAAKTEA